MTLLYVAFGGGIGAALRYLWMGAVARTLGNDFPYGTLTVNILGSVLMGVGVGVLARMASEHDAAYRAFLMVGLLGGFTTFSAFSLDAVTLIERGAWGAAFLYALLSVALCVGGLFAGLYLVREMVTA